MNKRPLVGVAVIIMKDRKVLLGKRKISHGAGTWAFPGGHLEFNETIEDCARREVFEETALYVKNIRYGTFTNDIFREEAKHYVTLFVVSEYCHGVLELKEPDKCEKWDWFHWGLFPEPLFLPLKNLLKQGFEPETFITQRLVVPPSVVYP
jgi:8-oxo-dGTP diphosphatase